MISGPGGNPATSRAAAAASGQDADRLREAGRLRRERPGWVIIWLAPINEFRAYRRLPGARHDTALTAATADDLAILISNAEQAARTPRPRDKQS